MSGPPGSALLLEREAELDALERVCEKALEGSGSLTLIEGEAGIGKSSLLGAGSATAERRGLRVLSARGRELEGDFSFGVVLQLLWEPLVNESVELREHLLSGPAALARPLLEPTEPSALAPPADARFTFLHGLHWLLANLAERAPVLIAIDDAHWADASTLELLAYLAGRSDGMPVAIAVTVRSGEGHRDPIDRLRLEEATRTLRLAPLTTASVARLVRLSLPEADEEFCSACELASGGNPLYLSSLLAAAVADELEPTGAGSDRIAGLRPREIDASVGARLDRLGNGARRLAQSVAVLGGEVSLAAARRLAGLDAAAAAEYVDRLAEAVILRAGEPLAFSHPLVREAVYRAIPSAALARAHRRAAELLRDRAERTERVASQLLRAERESELWAREVLLKAAGEASARGSGEAARGYLLRALEEAPAEAERGRLLAQLALVEATLGAQSAWDTLGEALALLPTATERGGALRDFTLRAFGGRQFVVSADRLRDEADALEDEDPDLAAELQGLALVSEAFELGPDRQGDLPRMQEILAREELARTPAGGALLGQAAETAALQCRPSSEVAAHARKAIAAARRFEDPDDLMTAALAANGLTLIDELSEAEAVLSEAIAVARRAGRALPYAVISHCRAINRYRNGRIDDALADAESAVSGYRDGWLAGVPGSHAYLSQAYLERGELERAGSALELPEDEAAWSGSIFMVLFWEARGRLRLAQGEAEDARSDFLRAGELAERGGLENPAVVPWRARAAVAARALGDDGEAIELAEEDLRRARSTGTPWGLGVCLHARGLAEAGVGAIEWLEQALEVLAGSPNRLEHARVLVDLGAALRRAGHRREARERLRSGLDLARACGALGLVVRAEQELLTAGARRVERELSGVNALTPSERRVCRMAAEGLSNKEIAAALFVTLRTVETHLTHSYDKLGIASRSELVRPPARATGA
ncbi:MAG: ATP-binding protein [Gaiellaceae bacterium]